MVMILQQFLNFEIMQKVFPLLLRGLGTTLYLCAIVIPLGLIGGLGAALLLTSKRAWVRWPAIVVVDFFRAIPPLVLLILLYSGLPFAGIRLSPVEAVALGFLLMIGMVLIADGFGVHVPKGYIYAAMAFSALVEGLNMMARRARRKREVPGQH